MEKLDNARVLARLKEKFEGSLISVEEPYGLLTIVIEKDANRELIKWLKEDSELKFIFLTDLCGIHFPDNKGAELGVIYHMHNLVDNVRLRIKTFFSSDAPKVRTVSDIFSSANWMERETFDFFGIRFEGHPELKRILNMDEMDYFPMLKQYPLEDANRADKNDKYFGR